VKSHRLCALLLVNLILLARAYAGGAYQSTDDRKKAFVWNNDPQPGDVANWTGARDEEGYATGRGTLSWSRLARGFTTGSNIAISRKKTPISSYSGTMVHGKFSGEVTTVDHGKTYHAKFADGQRKGLWERGPSIAKAEKVAPTETAKKSEVADSERSTSTASTAGEAEKVSSAKTPATDEPDVPAAGPEVAENSQTTEKTATSSQPLIAQASSEETDQSTPRAPATRKAALAPGAVRAFDRPTATPGKKSATQTIRKAERAKPEPSEKPAKAASSQPAELQTDVSEHTPSSPETETIEPPKLKTERALPEKTRAAANETPPDDSIQSLVGPPSSLRNPAAGAPTNSRVAEPPPPASGPPQPAAQSVPKLTAVQAMDIADIEARTRGFDLGEYQLPKAEYNAATDSWSVGYTARASGDSKKLSVTVQDKSGKAEVKK
jgi:hypothetical protein